MELFRTSYEVGPTQLSSPEAEPVGARHQSLELPFREEINNFILPFMFSPGPFIFVYARVTWTAVTSGHTALHKGSNEGGHMLEFKN